MASLTQLPDESNLVNGANIQSIRISVSESLPQRCRSDAREISEKSLHACCFNPNKIKEVYSSNRSLELVGLERCAGEEGVSLQYTRHERVPKKNFSAENRGFADVEYFINEAEIFLDIPETNFEDILDRMLGGLLNEGDQASLYEAKREIFTHDSAHQLCKTIQGTCNTVNGGVDYDQAWVTILCTLRNVRKRHIALARLKHPANLGSTSQEVYFIILVITPTREEQVQIVRHGRRTYDIWKGAKNALETSRTFATLFCDMELRFKLLSVQSKEEFCDVLWDYTLELAGAQANGTANKRYSVVIEELAIAEIREKGFRCCFGVDVLNDLRKRVPFYLSDFKDGFVGHRTLQKTFSTTLFLYFACLLPSIALGVLNDNNTHSKIGVKEVIWSQMIGGLFFAFLGGQPMVILLTTAPLALYTKVVYTISHDLEYDFLAMYAMVGIWNGFFLLCYALFGASMVMAWSTRSTEEIFALFISIAFTVDAVKDIVHDFHMNYDSEACNSQMTSSSGADDVSTTSSFSVADVTTESSLFNLTTVATTVMETATDTPCAPCLRENSVLFLLLAFGTVWLGLSILNFTKTPFLNAGKRELIADCALPVSVLFMSFLGSFVFRKVDLVPFRYEAGTVFEAAAFDQLTVPSIFVAMGLGFCLSLLFFMDQNISAAMVASPENKLKKGTSYHWDLVVVAMLNVFLTCFGLPMVHGALPHSPLHVRAMADMEDRVDQGHVYQTVMRVREQRITPILSHVLIGLSLLLLPYPLQYIPRAVLKGLFLYLAVTALGGNQLAERISLFFTEQSAYPPNHYIRSVPQRKVHLFTFLQLIQLAVMCGIGFSPMPYLKMVFPVLILLLLPIRHKLVALAFEQKHLKAIDGH